MRIRIKFETDFSRISNQEAMGMAPLPARMLALAATVVMTAVHATASDTSSGDNNGDESLAQMVLGELVLYIYSFFVASFIR